LGGGNAPNKTKGGGDCRAGKALSEREYWGDEWYEKKSKKEEKRGKQIDRRSVTNQQNKMQSHHKLSVGPQSKNKKRKKKRKGGEGKKRSGPKEGGKSKAVPTKMQTTGEKPTSSGTPTRQEHDADQ